MQVVGVEKIRVEDSAVDKRREVFAVLSDVKTNKMVDRAVLVEPADARDDVFLLVVKTVSDAEHILIFIAHRVAVEVVRQLSVAHHSRECSRHVARRDVDHLDSLRRTAGYYKPILRLVARDVRQFLPRRHRLVDDRNLLRILVVDLESVGVIIVCNSVVLVCHDEIHLVVARERALAHVGSIVGE